VSESGEAVSGEPRSSNCVILSEIRNPATTYITIADRFYLEDASLCPDLVEGREYIFEKEENLVS
jgi:hypothetical protein